MWTFQQSTGHMLHNFALVGTGYSGHDVCRNDPAKQDILMHGPIPRGMYIIELPPFDSKDHGPLVMRLHPDPANEMFGRAGFLIHGDSVKAPGTASEGCVVMPRDVREWVAGSGDQRLEVIE